MGLYVCIDVCIDVCVYRRVCVSMTSSHAAHDGVTRSQRDKNVSESVVTPTASLGDRSIRNQIETTAL